MSTNYIEKVLNPGKDTLSNFSPELLDSMNQAMIYASTHSTGASGERIAGGTVIALGLGYLMYEIRDGDYKEYLLEDEDYED